MQHSLECGLCCFIIIKCLVGFQEYFHYDILYVMNVTDVDDKIINRVRRNYLLDRFRAGRHYTHYDPSAVIFCVDSVFHVGAEVGRGG
jgi:cysteinyl-tRNA synthetase